MPIQTRLWSDSKNPVDDVLEVMSRKNVRCPLIVCDQFLKSNPLIGSLVINKNLKITLFSDYQANPNYDSIVKGAETFKENQCDFIISFGGGSSMDVGKGIKAVLSMKPDQVYFDSPVAPAHVEQLAIPTTAGTGSESTHFAVVYYHQQKQSIHDSRLLPESVLLDASFLTSLPDYQRKSGMLDALCQSIESFWAIHATRESQNYARQAIKNFLTNYQDFLENLPSANKEMLRVADLAGQAINISTTTAPHAMSYQLTKTFHIAHGHAVAICLPDTWNYMIHHLDLVQPPIEKKELETRFQEISKLLGCDTPEEAIIFLKRLLNSIGIKRPLIHDEQTLKELAQSVNVQRLSNNPVHLKFEDLLKIYRSILDTSQVSTE